MKYQRVEEIEEQTAHRSSLATSKHLKPAESAPASNNRPPSETYNAGIETEDTIASFQRVLIINPRKVFVIGGNRKPGNCYDLTVGPRTDKLDELERQMITLDITTDTYLADVFDIACKKRQLNKATHVLKLIESGLIVLLDRTVESIGDRTDLDLCRRRFATYEADYLGKELEAVYQEAVEEAKSKKDTAEVLRLRNLFKVNTERDLRDLLPIGKPKKIK
ncbi:hypothetical protein BDZ45DRAFT_750467 [Acephala macrosclerotiorum]|nr:hypothetical protein BDZ45DRAFT_750467 [Acephala macrosclerotiorum]